MDLELRRCLLALLRLKHYIEKKLKVNKLTEVMDYTTHDGLKLTEALILQLKL
jgi:hypothetical protein